MFHLIGRFSRCPIPRWTALLIMLLLWGVPSAQACSLDGIASLSLNGTLGTLTAGTPTGADAHYWAPFTLLAVARGDAVQLREDVNKVRNSLTPTLLKTPFRWSFDDGSTVYGWTVGHTFTQLGWHKFTVSYFWPARKEWLEFDSAQLRVVLPGDLLQANFAYYLQNIVGTIVVTVLRVLVWGAAAVIIGSAIRTRLQRRRYTEGQHWRRMPVHTSSPGCARAHNSIEERAEGAEQ